MDALVAETLKQGLIPPVGIAAGESSSFRWSTFDSTVQGIEITLSDGYIVWAS